MSWLFVLLRPPHELILLGGVRARPLRLLLLGSRGDLLVLHHVLLVWLHSCCIIGGSCYLRVAGDLLLGSL